MSDLNFQNFSSVQNNTQPAPNTVAGAATITPTTLITYVSGTTNVATVTPPVSGQHVLYLVFTNASPGALLTTGNVAVGSTTLAQNVPVTLIYDPARAKYMIA